MNEMEKIEDACELVSVVYEKIDKDNISRNRDIDDEFVSKIGVAAYSGSTSGFIERLRKRCGVRSIKDDKNVFEIIEKYEDNQTDFLRTIRNNKALVVLKMKDNLGMLD